MWKIRVESPVVEELASKQDHEVSELTLSVTVGMIRDGTNGISLSLGGEVVGEWTDSKGRSLTLTDDGEVGVCGRSGEVRYLVVMPGVPVGGEQISDTEIAVRVRI
jgi:hypothetical protein